MNRLSRQTREGSAKWILRIAALISTLSIGAACSSGDGVSIGTGQDADPVVLDFPIAYIRAPIPTDDNGNFEQNDLREQITFDFGADLFFRDRASPSAEAINITGEMTQGLAAIRDVEIACDGSSLLFAMRFRSIRISTKRIYRPGIFGNTSLMRTSLGALFPTR